jgi:uncharacterized repeat protein (TIGR02543 family)
MRRKNHGLPTPTYMAVRHGCTLYIAFLAFLLASCQPFNLSLKPAPNLRAVMVIISGVITAVDGKPIEGASVQLQRDGVDMGDPVLSGADGAYTIINIPAGTYTIAVSLAGYEPAVTGEFTLTGAEFTVPTLTIRPDGDPDSGDPDDGKPDEGDPDSGDPDDGNPDEGDPDSGDPDDGEPDEGDPDSGDPDDGEPDSGLVQYTITFDSQGGETVQAITKDEGTQIVKPGDPERPGYTFAGWFSAATGGSRYEWPHPLSADLIMYAQWTVDTGDQPFTLTIDGFTNPVDEAFEDFTLAKPNGTKTITITGNGTDTGTDITWYIGLVKMGVGNSITLNAANLSIGTHTLRVTAVYGGKLYSEEMTFTVGIGGGR